MRHWHRHRCCCGCGHHGHDGHHGYYGHHGHRGHHGHHGHRHRWGEGSGYEPRWRHDEWAEPWPPEEASLAWQLDQLREVVERLTDRLDALEGDETELEE